MLKLPYKSKKKKTIYMLKVEPVLNIGGNLCIAFRSVLDTSTFFFNLFLVQNSLFFWAMLGFAR